jgi:hydroxypyruvate isomerase
MRSVKISVPDWCYYPKIGPAEAYYTTLKRLGVDAVEMVAPEHHALARAAGLAIVNQSGPGMMEGLNRLENHAALLPQIRAAIRQAAADAIPLVIVFSGNRNGQPDGAGVENCRRGLEQLLPEAERHRIVLGFEMLCEANHPDYQASRSRYGFELCRRIASPWVKVLYDVYHMQRSGEDARADVTANLAHIAHLHLAESPQRSAPLADGNIPYRQIVPAIAKAGYSGYWGLEYCPQSHPLVELEQSIDMLRSLAG